MKSLGEMRSAMAVLFNEGGPWGGRGGGKGGGSGSGGGSGDGGSGDGGGNNGGGPRNPWSQPPEGDRPRGSKGPSALDELLKRARTAGGGGNFSGGEHNVGKWVGYGLVALVALWVILTSFHQIEPAERGVVTRMGRYSHTLGPGISPTLPAPFDRVTTVDVQNVRNIDIPGGAGDRLVLTGDQNLIDLEYTVRWTIRDPEQFLYQSVSPEGTIRSVAESTMRAALANMTFNQAVGSGRSQIESDVAARMQTILDGPTYRAGVRIQGVAIRQTDPPAQVVDAFKEVSAAQQNAQTSINGARAYAQQIIQKAEGDAGAFDRVYAQYKLAPEVTRRRMYYETMERVLSKVDKTIVEAPGVTPYLPLRELKRNSEPQSGGGQ